MKFILHKSPRAKRISLTIFHDGRLKVTMPKNANPYLAKKFIQEKWHWIEKKWKYFQSLKGKTIFKNDKKSYAQNKEHARQIIEQKIEYINKIYQFNFKKISIKNQKTRWGSCSKRKNLNFNYKISLLPDHIANYIIVHELCHLAELNHSKNFWELVSKTIPDHKKIRKELKTKYINLE